eukprot:2867872-Prymnesium_polylepis.2
MHESSRVKPAAPPPELRARAVSTGPAVPSCSRRSLSQRAPPQPPSSFLSPVLSRCSPPLLMCRLLWVLPDMAGARAGCSRSAARSPASPRGSAA